MAVRRILSMIELSERLKSLPTNYSSILKRKEKQLFGAGIDLINLRLGNPDQPVDARIIIAAQEALNNPSYSQYPSGKGLDVFLKAVADWFLHRFKVQLSTETEICALVGCKEGIAHLPLAFVNPGDVVLLPDPAYPVYLKAAAIAGATIYRLPLQKENGFLPDLESIPKEVLSRSKILFLNYPNNPLTVTAPRSFLESVVEWAHKHRILVAYDAAYSEIYFQEPTDSFLSIPGAREIGIEFHSLSKSFNMAGWRIGWVCGNSKAISALAKIKDNFDSGVFPAVQHAAAFAISQLKDDTATLRDLYKKRNRIFVDGLQKSGWNVQIPQGTLYVWAGVPSGFTSEQASARLLDEAGIVCTSGTDFGPSGEGYIRFSLTVDTKRLTEAAERIGSLRWSINYL